MFLWHCWSHFTHKIQQIAGGWYFARTPLGEVTALQLPHRPSSSVKEGLERCLAPHIIHIKHKWLKLLCLWLSAVCQHINKNIIIRKRLSLNQMQTTCKCVYFFMLVWAFAPVFTLIRWPWYRNLTQIFSRCTCTPKIKLLGQGFQNLEHEQHIRTHIDTLTGIT